MTRQQAGVSAEAVAKLVEKWRSSEWAYAHLGPASDKPTEEICADELEALATAPPEQAQLREPELVNSLRCVGGKLRMNLHDAAVLNPENFSQEGVKQLIAEWDVVVSKVVAHFCAAPPEQAAQDFVDEDDTEG